MSGSPAFKRIFSIWLFSLMVLTVSMVLLPEPVEASTALVEAHLEQESVSADVEPGEDGVVLLDGTVTCDNVGFGSTVQYVQVNLQANAEDWPAIVEPSTMTFDMYTDELPFEARVKVPTKTSCTESHILTVTGSWSAYPGARGGTVEPAEATIGVNQFCSFQLAWKRTSYNGISPGDELKCDIFVINKGNGVDSFLPSVMNIEDLNEKEIIVELSDTELVVGEEDRAYFILKLKFPKSISSGIHVVSMNVESVGSGNGNTVDHGFDLFFEVRKYSDVLSHPISVLIIGLIILITVIAVVRRRKKKRRKSKD